MQEDQPMGFLFKLLKSIRENILEQITIPGLDISWWEFVLGLIVAGILITILVNSVRASGDMTVGGVARAASRSERRSSRRRSD